MGVLELMMLEIRDISYTNVIIIPIISAAVDWLIKKMTATEVVSTPSFMIPTWIFTKPSSLFTV